MYQTFLMYLMILTIDGLIKSLQTISRLLKGTNYNAYTMVDDYSHMINVEWKERACGNRPAIISEDTAPLLDDVERDYKGEKGKDYYRGGI